MERSSGQTVEAVRMAGARDEVAAGDTGAAAGVAAAAGPLSSVDLGDNRWAWGDCSCWKARYNAVLPGWARCAAHFVGEGGGHSH